MARTPQDVTEAELSVLEALWELQPTSVRELTQRLYAETTTALNATVQKLLERLEAKSCVSRNRETWPHLFSAAVDREELIARQLQSTADRLCQGAISPLLTSLVKANGLSAADRKSLRGLLDELDQGPKKK